ncbi:MAG: glycosyltransferase [Microscillaceae bacterium]|nr:glycosyltransferase [Microscillaceae bacterium]MDW8461421.1 glycosyltransferase [Cytophagales bacterium]
MPIDFSVLIAYRDRNPEVVNLCLQSLSQQTYSNFEVCFLDYGSEFTTQAEVKALTQNFPFVRYFVSQTQGHFWNRSKALNFLAQQAQHEHILVLDIDLVLTSTFLEVLANYSSRYKLLSYAVYWLPPNGLISHFLSNTVLLAKLPCSYARGCIAYHKTDLFAVGGYDEFYCIWGVEDLDLVARIEYFTKQNIQEIPLHEGYAFHVWHQTVANQMPTNWYKYLYHYYFEQKKAQNFANTVNYLAQPISLLNMQDRPILLQREQPDSSQIIDFHFTFPFLRSFNLFYHTFYTLPKGKFLRIKQKFSPLPQKSTSFKVKILQTLNYFLQKLSISYRFTEIIYYDTELVTANEIRSFLFYFIHTFKAEIKDYYFDFQNDTIECWLHKG